MCAACAGTCSVISLDGGQACVAWRDYEWMSLVPRTVKGIRLLLFVDACSGCQPQFLALLCWFRFVIRQQFRGHGSSYLHTSCDAMLRCLVAAGCQLTALSCSITQQESRRLNMLLDLVILTDMLLLGS